MFGHTAELYDLFYDWKDYAAESAKLQQIVAARAPGARTLLDVACGTGRHLEHLRSWYEVEGLDLDAGLLEVATKRLASIPLHQGDMRDFDLGHEFDVVTCLFSGIGYVGTVERLEQAIATMARHLTPVGILVVEPWLAPGDFDPHHIGRVLLVERPGLSAVRMNGSRVEGTLSVLDFHYLIARPGTVEYLTETHSLGLFTQEQYRSAFERAALGAEYDEEGLMGRGLWTASR